MKFTFFILLSLSFSLGIAQTSNSIVAEKSLSKEMLQLLESEYDFGKIPQGKPVTHIFSFKNIASVPIALENVQASCGCTTPEWNKSSVLPGQLSNIVVGYNAASEGAFNKTITMTYGGQSKVITIKGDVWKTPITSAPSNIALEKLKSQP